MFVFEALVLTFMTTPVVSFLYPPEVRRRVTKKGPDYLTAGEGLDGNGVEKGTQRRISNDDDDDRRKMLRRNFALVTLAFLFIQF